MRKDYFEKIFSHCEENELRNEEEKLRVELLIEPNEVKKLEKLALVLYLKSDYSGAIKLYEKMLKLAKRKSPDKIAFLGYLYYENEKYTEAIELYNKFLEMKPHNAFVHFLLGNAYARVGDILEAVKSYDFSIFLDFDIYKAHLDFAKKYEYMGLYERALREYITAYEIDPRDKDLSKKIKEIKKKVV